MRLAGLRVADDPGRWRSAGFALDDTGRFAVGGLVFEVVAGDGAIVEWTLAGDRVPGDLDGLATRAAQAPAHDAPEVHPNGAIALDHVVIATPDLGRTTTAFAAAGLHARRVREAGMVRQAFYVLGPALAEVAGPGPDADPPADPGAPARFWGLTFVVGDLDAAAAALGERLGTIRAAIQPDRRIATLRREDGLAVPVALMTPRSEAPAWESPCGSIRAGPGGGSGQR